MRGLAADDATQADHDVGLFGSDQVARCHRQLERAGDPGDRLIALGHPMAAQLTLVGLQQVTHKELVEPRGRNAHAQPLAVQRRVDHFRFALVAHSSCPIRARLVSR